MGVTPPEQTDPAPVISKTRPNRSISRLEERAVDKSRLKAALQSARLHGDVRILSQRGIYRVNGL